MIPGTTRIEADTLRVQLRRVLVVDEALPIRRKLQDSLARAGYQGSEMRLASTAEEALEAFALDHPDLVFAELVGQDPEEGLRMIVEMLHVDPRARIVLLTAESPDSPLVRRAIRSGVFAIIPKPLRHEKVRQVLSEIEAEDGGIERFR